MKTAPQTHAGRRCGFTFAEVLAAMVLLAILVPAISRGLAVATRAASLAESDTRALNLAENQLHLLLATTNYLSSVTSGDFGSDWPRYRWALERTSWPEDTMTLLTLDVSYEARGRTRNVRLSTLVGEEGETL